MSESFKKKNYLSFWIVLFISLYLSHKIINIKQIIALKLEPPAKGLRSWSCFGLDKTRLEETYGLVETGTRLHVPGLVAQEILGKIWCMTRLLID